MEQLLPSLSPPLCASPAVAKAGDSLLMPVRINSRGAPLLSFNLRVTYDDSLLAVEGCRREVADKHRWSCNYQLTAGEVIGALCCAVLPEAGSSRSSSGGPMEWGPFLTDAAAAVASQVRIVVFNEDGINGAAEFQGSAVRISPTSSST